ncbi:hypothetical protein VJ923_06160 [Adlercreutzia sp. R25]|uniref:Uncharacterized protein n=1 Tax=Adlercreutzia shanghongiae TaxID=3111773 RepID=A0ABU6IXG9_9ACTN|nr:MULTISPECIES: hypothetical protein [unclassified Adlercreutzia]MEC4272736.1 hypothetical protein [Adlercreutzia sp. R25]MEC4294365.1 hypothetical protein [Adlercreutzia sp. R22]
MGGRGASSGSSKAGNRYGSQYRTLASDGDLKLVVANSKEAETLVESMTPGRIYAVVNQKNGNLKSVIFNGGDGKRAKRVDLDHFHEKKKPHAHDGYLDGVFRGDLTQEESAVVDRAISLWETYRRKT